MEITCPSCSSVLEGDESLRGQTIDCPACQAPIPIPASARRRIHAPPRAVMARHLPTAPTSPAPQPVVIVDVQIPFRCILRLTFGVLLSAAFISAVISILAWGVILLLAHFIP